MTIKTLLIILALFLLIQVIVRWVRRFFKFPAPAIIGRFLDSDLRRKIQPPGKLIQRSGIKKGMRVLEVGCGSGAFIAAVARAVGRKGKVYALDIQPGMLKQLENKLARLENQDIRNVKPILGDACKLPFKNNALDLVYMVTVLQEIPDKQKALKEVKRVLKPSGIMAVTELLPDPDYPFKSTTISMGKKAGFILDKVSGDFWNYTVRFVKPEK